VAAEAKCERKINEVEARKSERNTLESPKLGSMNVLSPFGEWNSLVVEEGRK